MLRKLLQPCFQGRISISRLFLRTERKQTLGTMKLQLTCYVCPPAIPEFFAHNMGFRLQANHSLPFLARHWILFRLQDNYFVLYSLEGNVWRKVVSTSKKTIWERDQRFFAVVLSKMDLGNVDTRKM